MAAPLYNPPTKVVTLTVPYLALVTRADPNFNKLKFWDVEYEFDGKHLMANPYQRWPFDAPHKTTLVNYNGGVTFAHFDITGVGFDFVKLVATNPNPGVMITLSAAQMLADIQSSSPSFGPPGQYALRFENFGGVPGSAGEMFIQPGPGVTFVQQNGNAFYPNGQIPIDPGTFSDFVVAFSDANDATFTQMNQDNQIHSVGTGA